MLKFTVKQDDNDGWEIRDQEGIVWGSPWHSKNDAIRYANLFTVAYTYGVLERPKNVSNKIGYMYGKDIAEEM